MSAAPVDRYGRPGGPLVIALHGAVANAKTWLPLARLLPPHFELWCPDLPGHGRRRDEPFTRGAALETVAALVASARPRRAIVAGDSLGGYLALEAAASLSQGIAGAVAGGCSWSMTGAGGALARATDLPARLVEALAGTARCDAWFAALLSRIVDRNDARAIVDRGLRVRARGESLDELRGFDVVRVARRVRVPLAIVNGAFDWPTRAGEGALLAAVRDSARFIAPRSGHGVGLFAPMVFVRAIADVVARGADADRRRGA